MTARKAAAKKAAAAEPDEVVKAKRVEEAASPEMEGEAYQVGFVGVSSDDEDHSFAAEAKRLED